MAYDFSPIVPVVHGNSLPTNQASAQFDMAMEMMYDDIRPKLVYHQKKYIPLPLGEEKRGYGNILFMLTPSQDHTIEEIQADFLGWFRSQYKWYTTDAYFKAKIGKKRIVTNMNSVIRRDWANTRFPHPLRYAAPAQRRGLLKRCPNVIVDLGEWTKFYFQYSFKITIPIITTKYMEFLIEKLTAPEWGNYSKKVLYMPINQWFSDRQEALGFDKAHLNNPLAIMLISAYKFPHLIAKFPQDIDIILGDYHTGEFVKLVPADFTKKNFNFLKQRLKQIRGFKWDESTEHELEKTFSEEELDENSALNNETNVEEYADPKKVVPVVDNESTKEEKARAVKIKKTRTKLINDMKRNMMGKPTKDEDDELEDMTGDDEVYDDEDIEAASEDLTPVHTEDEELDDEVEDAIDEKLKALQESDPDALVNNEITELMTVVVPAVKERVKRSYVPQRSSEDIKRIQEMRTTQDKILTNRMPTAKQVASKKIETKSFANVVPTKNRAVTESKFANFDRDYNEKKFEAHLDSAVAKLGDAQVKVFVVDKQVEDTSDPLNMKKTYTYTLQDEYGNKHKIVVDVPILIEDKYIFINGMKKLLSHQQIMMPIVKSSPVDVQIVTWYNKLILRREGINDTRTAAVKGYLSRNANAFGIRVGNAMAKNASQKYPSTLDIDMYARNFMSFNIGHNYFILDREVLRSRMEKLGIKANFTSKTSIPVGYNSNTKSAILVEGKDTLTEIIVSKLPPQGKSEIIKTTKAKTSRMLRTKIKIQTNGSLIPLILILFYYEGFDTIMKKAEINYHVIKLNEGEKLPPIEMDKYDILALEDCFVVWERNPIWNAMLMNGLTEVDLSQYTLEDLNDRDMVANILTNYYPTKNIVSRLMQYYDFMIDDCTKEILEDLDLPTDLVSLMILGNRMLADNYCTPINTASAYRIRSNEIIAQYLYKEVTDAYANFRNTQGRMGRNRKPDSISIKRDAIIAGIGKSQLTTEASVLNPILELEKARGVTPRGPRGVGKDRAMTLDKRTYDPSNLGILAMTTSPDAKVGIVRQLTLEPNITSTLGYTKQTDIENAEELSNANLLSPAELLSPPGALHDDGPRTAMSFKQTQYMLPIEGSTPVFFGNRVETVVPYHMSREFVVTAKQDGKVVAIEDGIVVVQYKDGTYDSFDTNYKMKNNSSSGFFIQTRMETSLKEVGQKFVANEVIAQDPRAFTKSKTGRYASMNVGVPIKVAIIANYDIYEDAGPITQKLSDKFTTNMAMKEECGIPANSYVESIVEIGDRVEVGDPLIVYDPAHDDDETNAFLNELRSKLGEDLQSLVDLKSMPQVRTDYAGIVTDIQIFTSVPVSELSPSLQKVYKKLTRKSKKKAELLEKYANPNDAKYIKCGQMLTDAPDIIKPDYQNRVKGVIIGNDGRGVVIFFYVTFKDIAKTGDKGSAFTALKFTTSHVIPEGREPYSMYRPDEEISAILAPGAVLARKVPSIQETMFANKCIIEMKRHALQIFFEDTDPRKNWDGKF